MNTTRTYTHTHTQRPPERGVKLLAPLCIINDDDVILLTSTNTRQDDNNATTTHNYQRLVHGQLQTHTHTHSRFTHIFSIYHICVLVIILSSSYHIRILRFHKLDHIAVVVRCCKVENGEFVLQIFVSHVCHTHTQKIHHISCCYLFNMRLKINHGLSPVRYQNRCK